MNDHPAVEHYPFVLPALQFRYGGLEPLMDAATVEIHHAKHHAGYVKNLNAALENHPDFHSWTMTDILTGLDALPESIRLAVRNNAGGHENHRFFWEILQPPPSGPCSPALVHAIESTFSSFPAFTREFTRTVLGLFGSGWVVLAADPAQGGRLKILSLANHESALSRGLRGLLICDVWEHAYYLKHQNRRQDYVDCFWKLVNWDAVSRRYEDALAPLAEGRSSAGKRYGHNGPSARQEVKHS